MTLPTMDAQTKTYCNCLAQQRGLDPVGYAGTFTDAIIVEVPLPWKREIMREPGALPQPILDLLALWLERYEAGEGYPHRPLVIAPDPDYSVPGFRRVLHFTRPDGLFAQFDRAEYLVPEAEVGPLVWALYQDQVSLPRFDAYRVAKADTLRDILVCTHGTVDAACARFGYPLYKHMRDTYAGDHLRVWRVSHFGGHVFAPTLMDMPSGHYWAYVENEQAARLIHREDDVSTMRGHYRGWAGLDNSFLHAAERDLWQRHGWEWFDFPKRGETLAQDDDPEHPQWAEVRIRYAPSQAAGEQICSVRVEESHRIVTHPSTSHDDTYDYPQYRVARMEDSA
jgi:hypothetical protein